MKKLFLVVLTLLLAVVNVKATNVSGTLLSNTQWTLANSPYIVTANLTVNNGVTLTIDSGVVVRLNPAVSMTVNGQLTANRITIEANDASQARGKYNSLIFNNAVSLTNSSIESATLIDFANAGSKQFTNVLIGKITNGIQVRAGAQFDWNGGNLSDCSRGFYLFGNVRVNLASLNLGSLDGVAFESAATTQNFNTLSLNTITVAGAATAIQLNVPTNILTSGVNSFSQITNNRVNVAFSTVADSLRFDALPIPYFMPSSFTVQTGKGLQLGTSNQLLFPNNATFSVQGNISGNQVTFGSQSGQTTRGLISNFRFAGRVEFNNCQINSIAYIYIDNATEKNFNNCVIAAITNGFNLGTNAAVRFLGGSLSNGQTGFTLGISNDLRLDGMTISQVDNEAFVVNGTSSSLHIKDITVNNVGTPFYFNQLANLYSSGNNQFTQLNTRKNAWIQGTTLNYEVYLGYLPIPFHFASSFQIGNTGRLELAGNNVFKSSSYIYVSGILVANAAAGSSLYFTSIKDDNWGGDSNGDGNLSSPARNDWGGILFYETSVDTANVLRRCQIRFANYGIETRSASPTIDSCTISIVTRCASFSGESSPVFTNNTLASSSQVPMALDFNADPVMSGNSFSFSDNQYDAIGLIGSQVTRNNLIKVRSLGAITNITYVMLNSELTILSGRTLTIAPGVVIKHTQNTFSYNFFRVDGTLVMEGKADSLITLTSIKDDAVGNPFDTNKDGNGSTPSVNDLGPIFITETAQNTRIRYANLKYMGGSYYYTYYTHNAEPLRRDAAIIVYNNSPLIKQVTIENGVFGIFTYRSSFPVIDSVHFVNLSAAPISLSMSANPTISNINFTNVGWRALGLLGRDVSANGTVNKRTVAGFANITYVVFDHINIKQGTHIDIEDGVIIKFANTSSYITVEGSLRTLGTLGSKVVFTSMKNDNVGNPGDTNGDGSGSSPTRGDWGRIEFLDPSNDTTSLLSHLEIHYPTLGLVLRNANTRLRNVLINLASSYGIITYEASRPDIDSTTIQNCNGDPIALSYASDPVFGNAVVFSQNLSSGLFLHETVLNSPAQLKSKTVAGINNIAYIIETVDINTGGRLTIDPAVVIKMRRLYWYSSSYLNVSGGVNAFGTHALPIYITSWRDDSVGGDTNNDGNGSVPSNTDFNYIRFTNVSDSSRAFFKNVLIKYGGYSSQGMIDFVNSAGFIDSCNLEHVSTQAIRIAGTSNPRIRNTKFFNIPNDAPIFLSMFSNPELHINNEVQNVAYVGLKLIPEVYSQDATFRFRSFAGIDSITYLISGGASSPGGNYGSMVVANGTTITVPAGMTFKYFNTSSPLFLVEGRLQMLGTASHPIMVTDYRDDALGRPADMNGDGSASLPPNFLTGTYNNVPLLRFDAVSNDSSQVHHVHFKYGAQLALIYNASPELKHCRIENSHSGVHLYGSSAPVLDSCVFHNLIREPLNTSVLTWPASTSGNILSGTTFRVVAIPGETLVQDITLQKRSFGGMTNVPYYFPSGYTVANNAVLTLSPGLVLKFGSSQQMVVNKGLLAIGGFSPDSNIVFTSISDDFYGGDSDPNAINSSANVRWSGVLVNNEAIDNQVQFKHVIFRNGINSTPQSYAFIRTVSASPSITYCTFDNGIAALSASAASNPLIQYCDFKQLEWGVHNANLSFNIDARNNWWGDNSGPQHSGNPTGIGVKATDSVRYTPWLVNGSNNPILGDVSLNGQIQAFDAAMVLQANVSLITLNSVQEIVGDVTGNNAVSAMDASYILQYSTGLINKFPAEELFVNRHFPDVSRAVFALGQIQASPGHLVRLPLQLKRADGIMGADVSIQFDPAYLQFSGLENQYPGLQISYQLNPVTGDLRLSLAGIHPLASDVLLAELMFDVNQIPAGQLLTPLTFGVALGNETDLLATAEDGFVEINARITTSIENGQKTPNVLGQLYPNPMVSSLTIPLLLDKNAAVSIEITDMLGRRMQRLDMGVLPAGEHQLHWDGKTAAGSPVTSGQYLLKLMVAGQLSVQPILVK